MNGIQRNVTAPQFSAVNYTNEENSKTASNTKAVSLDKTIAPKYYQSSTSSAELSPTNLEARKAEKALASKKLCDKRYSDKMNTHKDALEKSFGKDKFKEIIDKIRNSFENEHPLDREYYLESIKKNLRTDKFPVLFMKYHNNKEGLADILYNKKSLIRLKKFDSLGKFINSAEYNEMKVFKKNIICRYHAMKRKKIYSKLMQINIGQDQNLKEPLIIPVYLPSGIVGEVEIEISQEKIQKNSSLYDNQTLDYLSFLITTNNNQVLNNLGGLTTTDNPLPNNIDGLVTTDNPLPDNVDGLVTTDNLLPDNIDGLVPPDNLPPDNLDNFENFDNLVYELITTNNLHPDNIDDLMSADNQRSDNADPSPVITDFQPKETTPDTESISIKLPNGFMVNGFNQSNITLAQKLLELLK